MLLCHHSALFAVHAHAAAAEDLLVLAAIVICESLAVHSWEDGALLMRLSFDGQPLVRSQALLEVVAILVTVVQGVELATTRGPIKRLKHMISIDSITCVTDGKWMINLLDV